jgi:DNA polymerase-1
MPKKINQDVNKYMIYDIETENHRVYKRLANPFSDKNWCIYRGWKVQGDKKCFMIGPIPKDAAAKAFHIADVPFDKVKVVVGFNLKFDLLYDWKSQTLVSFFKDGGRIWDCQYAEYLLEAQHPDAQMCSLDSIVEKYGGRKKIDEVKILWNQGMLTSQIDPGLMEDYLIGTAKEKRNSGDIGNTELIYLGQLKRATELGMLPMIQARMDGLCATTEMEYNGLKIDIAEAQQRCEGLTNELAEITRGLEKYIPALPPELEFNWGSPNHRSALIFGGAIKYEKQSGYIDPKTNKEARYKAYEEVQDGTYTSGAKKGSPRIRKVEVPGELRTRKTEFIIDLPGYIKPKKEWEGKNTDARGKPIYQTNVEVIDTLKDSGIPFLELMGKRNDITKDLGTYYLQYDERKDEYTGMLICVDNVTHIVHHNLNHTNTVTTRLSSNNPNLQNIPTEGTSEVKKMFVSRFHDGGILEVDYKQLEVVVQGMLSRCKQLCQDLRDGIDFHCKRVSAKFGIPYEEALYLCKDESAPDHKMWKNRRRGCKEFSFQRAFGAGADAISKKTGMSKEEVEALIISEDRLYPGIPKFNLMVESTIKKTAKPFKQFFEGGGSKVYRRGYWVSPTGTRYSFRTYNSPDWMRERGIQDSFMPTEMKNYPVQGTAGEIVQIVIGKLWRKFSETSNFQGAALLCNTVHDCVWIDVDVPNTNLNLLQHSIKQIMESVPQYLKELYGMDVTVPFPVSMSFGKNLYEQKEI